MNRLSQLFQKKWENLLSIYFTAGYPNLSDTPDILLGLQDAGADIVEVGMPYSDPVADGPVIQESSKTALMNGMTVKVLFEQLNEIKNKLSIPIVLMGYINPILQFGIENFCSACSRCGVDGLIVPDMPVEVYLENFKPIMNNYHLSSIFLVSPNTDEERIKLLDSMTTGFIYLVSGSRITGGSVEIQNTQLRYFERIQKMMLNNPSLIGFGISDHQSFKTASTYANGAIVGTAFIKMLSKSKNYKNDITNFINNIKTAENVEVENKLKNNYS